MDNLGMDGFREDEEEEEAGEDEENGPTKDQKKTKIPLRMKGIWGLIQKR